MNIRPRAKYGFSPEEVEKRALESERFKVLYNMHRLEKTNQIEGKIGTIKKMLEKTKKVKRIFKHWRKSVYFSRKNKEKDCTWKIL